MSKTGKQKNDLRRFRPETVMVFLLGAVFCLLFLGGAVAMGQHPILFAAISLVLYLGICAAATYLLEKRYHIRTRDETLAPVMGRIMFDAVVKMNAPVFICGADERIIWYNNATDSLHSSRNKLYGESVYDLFGVTLADIRGNQGGSGAHIHCEGRSFLARYSHIKTDDDDFAMVVTTEITELEQLKEQMNGDEVAVCYIIIDNLNEMMQYDSELYRPATAKIDEILRTWADEHDGILKEYERDKYLFVTRSRVLDELIAGKFDILDRVRAMRVGENNLPLTISLGVSNIHGSFEDKEKAAHAALEMALQRGGDQAAIKGDGSMDFFGGISKGVQKRTNVRARVVSGELITAIRGASNVLIMGHRAADFDAFGSCVGLARIAMNCGARVNVVIDMADRNLMGCRDMLAGDRDFDGVFIGADTALDLLETGTLVIVSDVNNLANTEAPELAYRTEKLAVIDHHRKMSEFEKAPDVEYIEPSASATCEIVAEMLEQVLSGDELTSAEASVMLAGIALDTKQFTKNTGTRTFSAAMYLRGHGANPAAVQSLFRESFSDYRREIKFRRNVEIYRDVCALTFVEDSDGNDRIMAAKAADSLLMVEGVQASFVLVQIENTIHVSARSSGQINVQLIVEELGGGGHYDSAGVQCKGKTMAEVETLLKQAIDGHIA